MNKVVLSLVLWLGVVTAVTAEPVKVQVLDQQGVALEDAVVEFQLANPPVISKPTEVAQKELTFVPFVTAVQKGALIEFPNQDKTRHHVYSFSPAKVFELKLYAGKPEAPVLFDKTGIVALGCNIHDYMQAYIYVGDSPYLAVSAADGAASVSALPPGAYQLKVWHPWQQAEQAPQAVQLPVNGVISVTLPVNRQQKPQKPKRGFGNSYP